MSSVGRSKHAIELEKRAANLLIEEGNTFTMTFAALKFYFSMTFALVLAIVPDNYFLMLLREGIAEDESSECTGKTCPPITSKSAPFCHASAVSRPSMKTGAS